MAAHGDRRARRGRSLSGPVLDLRLLEGASAHAPDVPGMLVAILAPLADAGIPVMAVSTFHADVVLVPAGRLAEAAAALRAAGHGVALAPSR